MSIFLKNYNSAKNLRFDNKNYFSLDKIWNTYENGISAEFQYDFNPFRSTHIKNMIPNCSHWRWKFQRSSTSDRDIHLWCKRTKKNSRQSRSSLYQCFKYNPFYYFLSYYTYYIGVNRCTSSFLHIRSWAIVAPSSLYIFPPSQKGMIIIEG